MWWECQQGGMLVLVLVMVVLVLGKAATCLMRPMPCRTR